MYFVFYGLHDTTLQICIISLYECFAYDITVVVKINLFQCQCQCQFPTNRSPRTDPPGHFPNSTFPPHDNSSRFSLIKWEEDLIVLYILTLYTNHVRYGNDGWM